ncbi:hypothetical protein ACFLZO_00075 [Patescibacteria group bacterium]
MMRFLLYSILVFSVFSIPISEADAERPSESVVLPVDQKLVDVAWLCPGGHTCTAWFLSRLIRNNEETQSYVFTDKDRTVIVTETRQPLTWKWDKLETIELLPGQRLLNIEFRCTNGTCRPWYLTRRLRDKERARSYTFTDSHTVLLIHESELP